MWILEFYSLPAKLIKFVSPDRRVVRISGIQIFGLFLYVDPTTTSKHDDGGHSTPRFTLCTLHQPWGWKGAGDGLDT